MIYLLTPLILLIDQVTKYIIEKSIPPGDNISIIPGLLRLSHVQNEGAAFGILQGQQIFLKIVTFIAFAFIIFMLWSTPRKNLMLRVALLVILGGALGNFTDRITQGFVVDFIDFFIGTHHWPSFNVADSAICVGMALLIFDIFRSSIKTKTSPPPLDRHDEEVI
jgi:signal peptidase II